MLNNSDINIRLNELEKLVKNTPKPESNGDVNNHIHTFYSFSPYSPTKAVWMAYTSGLMTAGIMDHDSVAGCKEFIKAGEIVGIATTIGVECRADFSKTKLNGKQINNPDQKSIGYVALHSIPHKNIDIVAKFFKPYTEKRNIRNKKMVDILNREYGFNLDWEKDIVSISKLNEGGSITERHILFALANKILKQKDDVVSYLKNEMKINLSEKNIEFLKDRENPFIQYDLLGALKSELVEKFYIDATDECPDIKEIVALSKKVGAICAYAYLGDVADSVTGDKKTQKFEDDYLDMLFEVISELGFDAVTYMPTRNSLHQLVRLKDLCEKYELMEISGEDINSPRQVFICGALKNPIFKNLIHSTWELIRHERGQTIKKGEKHMKFNLMHPKEQLVTIMDRIYKYGMTTTSGGNLSIKDEDGDIWITPSGVDKGSLTPDDIVCVKPDGTVIGKHKPSIELPFHSDVYKIRPDVGAVLHAHPPTLVSFSLVRKIPNTSIISNVTSVCGKIEMAPYDLPGSTALGEKIAKVFKKGINTVMLENHGVVIAGKDLFSAFMSFETLDFCARLEINAKKIGNVNYLKDDYVTISKAKPKLEEFTPKYYSSKEKEARSKMCALIKRSYDQQLFTSTQGSFSQRTDNDNFVITPSGKDRKYLEPTDLVRIENGKKEQGKMPSGSVLLHQAIYKKHPEINAIGLANSPNVMAFACTDQEFDSKTIPESYIMLRDVPKLPFGSSLLQPELTANEIKPNVPVMIIENDCVLVTGNTLINAFDRLEVLEYSAKAIIDAKVIGDIIKINQAEITEIDEAFNLVV
jgi:L-fuculose-phosphate aldolase